MSAATDPSAPPAGWEIIGPAPKACSRCPWRLSNQGQPHPHGFYLAANLRRLWGGLKDGERMSCHPTDPRMAEFEGYEKQAGRCVTRECAGALTLIQRELHLFVQACRDSEEAGEKAGGFKLYRSRRPRFGMSRDGLHVHALGLATSADCAPLGIRAMGGLTVEQINDPEVGYSRLPWTPIDRFLVS